MGEVFAGSSSGPICLRETAHESCSIESSRLCINTLHYSIHGTIHQNNLESIARIEHNTMHLVPNILYKCDKHMNVPNAFSATKDLMGDLDLGWDVFWLGFHGVCLSGPLRREGESVKELSSIDVRGHAC